MHRQKKWLEFSGNYLLFHCDQLLAVGLQNDVNPTRQGLQVQTTGCNHGCQKKHFMILLQDTAIPTQPIVSRLTLLTQSHSQAPLYLSPDILLGLIPSVSFQTFYWISFQAITQSHSRPSPLSHKFTVTHHPNVASREKQPGNETQ